MQLKNGLKVCLDAICIRAEGPGGKPKPQQVGGERGRSHGIFFSLSPPFFFFPLFLIHAAGANCSVVSGHTWVGGSKLRR